MRTRALPSRPPDRIYGGRGTGSRCAICGHAVAPREVELALVFDDDPDGEKTYFAHQRCYARARLGQRP